MTMPPDIRFVPQDLGALAGAHGRVVVFVAPDGTLPVPARRIDRLTRGALTRAVASDRFADLSPGSALDMAFPAGMAAEAVQVVKLDRRADTVTARRAGAAVAAARGRTAVLVLAGALPQAADIALGLALRDYAFEDHKTGESVGAPRGPVSMMVTRPDAVARAARDDAARAEGVHFTRDLINAPANVLTTDLFAAQLAAMQALGLDVEILEEAELERLGMRTLLAVGQGSASPSKVVVMRWQGGTPGAAPLALVGKGVIFDTGGISIKPAQGMEEMTADMGGAGVVAGVMRTLALRRAKANVVGLVGLVENMPDGRAMRPGDVIRSMKGDTVEIINTDAEGRLVLADVLWYAQDRFKPAALIDLATLTGAVIVALGHDKAGVFSTDDGLADAFLKAAAAEGEGAWRLPLDPAYDKPLKSRVADMRNSAGRAAGAATAAMFLKRFVRDGVPWMHLDIAGVTLPPEAARLAPKGATGWGVLSLDRLVADRFEG
ncbi:leucyl aminopeptidase [Meridianimarinicoccus sp. RP-17]|uniref:leucyl aminopeptidase n=1 Tax=Meridianimarinicoccus zhengii TaxID=2056810 RepID=UPI000DAC2D73|nr:leucyl aminopeptidase [Phycocomes zhengii]